MFYCEVPNSKYMFTVSVTVRFFVSHTYIALLSKILYQFSFLLSGLFSGFPLIEEKMLVYLEGIWNDFVS
jgi:hypothetical protein